jgi:acyl-coenzyme A synthetase/AMP-(fatty) acid ligase
MVENMLQLPLDEQSFSYLGETLLCFDDHGHYSWNDLRSALDKAREEMLRINDDAVAIYHEDSYEFLVLLLAAWQCGKTVLVAPDNLPATCELMAEYTDSFWGQLSAVNAKGLCEKKPSAGGVLLMFTSGSTGEPTAIAKSFSQLNAECILLQQQFSDKLLDCCVATMVSHHHQYGLIFHLLWSLLAQRPFYRQRVQFFEKLPLLCKRFDLALVASPAQLANIPGSVHLQGNDVLQVVFSAGAVLTKEAANACEQNLGVQAIEIYGSTEAGACAWRSGNLETRWSTLPGVEVREGASACLALKTATYSSHEEFQTSDLVEIDDDGLFRLKGRVDTIVKLAGKRISLQAVQQLLMDHAWVSDVRLLPHARRRDRLGAVVQLNEAGAAALIDSGQRAVSKAIAESLRRELEAVALPRYWRFVREIPCNSQGKTTQAELKALFEDEAAQMLPNILQVRKSEDGVEIDFTVPPTLHYLKGHFPGNPILPGVVQLTWAEQYGSEYFPLVGDFSELEAVKFQQIIQPGMRITLCLQWQEEKKKLIFAYTSERFTHSSGRIVFKGAA